MQQTVRVAAVQAESAWLDLAAGVDKVISLIGEAAAGGARLVAFPETFVPGYPWWIWLDSPAAGMAFVPAYAGNSMTRDSAELNRIRRAAAQHHIYVVLGFSERAGGSLYMAQAFISETGELISVRRRLKPTHVERAVFGEGAGSDLRVHDAAPCPSSAVHRGGPQALGPELNTAASLLCAVWGQTFVLPPCPVTAPSALQL